MRVALPRGGASKVHANGVPFGGMSLSTADSPDPVTAPRVAPPSPPTPVQLRFDHVVKRFGAQVAVAGVNLDIHAGEFFSLLGPSGCGKTTLLRMIAGFEFPDEGAILLDGQDLTVLPAHKRPVNTVFQHYALFPHLSVLDNVAFGLRRAGVAEPEVKRRSEEALGQVQLGEFAGRAPNQLSGGQKQRVALARALVLRPRVLLLDEPLGALDHKLRLEMQVELKHLQRACGITFIFVTHDQPEAMTMSDRIAVLSRGRIEQVGTAWEVYERPATEFVARFLGASNVLAGRVVAAAADHVEIAIDGGPTGRFPVFRQPPAVGESVKVMLRPEWLTLSRSRAPLAPAVGTSWPVAVRERIYQGAVTRWTVEGLGPDPLEVSGTPTAVDGRSEGGFPALEDVEGGEAATLSWRAGAGVVLFGGPP